MQFHKMRILLLSPLLLILFWFQNGCCSDITAAVYGNDLSGMPAAFGDFNSDELTDVFVIRGEGKNSYLEIQQASNDEPLLSSMHGTQIFLNDSITSVVPGNFDGDVFMDVMVTCLTSDAITEAHILWGNNQLLNRSGEIVIKMKGQPLALDYDHDMIIDLFGMDVNGTRTFWHFNEHRRDPIVEKMENPPEMTLDPIREPHSNAFVDLGGDHYADLVITCAKHLEIWNGTNLGFMFWKKIPMNFSHFGQFLFMDVDLKGELNLIVPVCNDDSCSKTTIMIWMDAENTWQDLKPAAMAQVNFATDSRKYLNTMTLHGGDFNMDGYPDLLATLQTTDSKTFRSFLLENVKAEETSKFNRTFRLMPNALSPFNNNETVLAVFYDFYQDGVLDVILVKYSEGNKYTTAALKNSLDYDENFVKVMVLTGRSYIECPVSQGRFSKKKRTCGTNLPGPSIAYKTITQDGNPRSAIAVQLPQSAHFALNLPFTTFGLGRTPNFIDFVSIGIANKTRDWPQIIPNSQMVVIPNPIEDPSRWKVQLFVTPSKLIVLSAAALTATCGLITVIIGILYWKERREDKIEKQHEAHRFHFDAM